MLHIVKQDQETLILQDNNYIANLVGVIFIITGLFIIFKPSVFINNPPTIFGIISSALGLFGILVAKITTITINKTLSKVIFNWKSIIKKDTKEYALNLIKELELRPTYDSNNDGGRSFHSFFIFQDGNEVALDPYGTTTSRFMNARPNTEISLNTQIANFMGIPFVELRPPTLQETLTAITSKIPAPNSNSKL